MKNKTISWVEYEKIRNEYFKLNKKYHCLKAMFFGFVITIIGLLVF